MIAQTQPKSIEADQVSSTTLQGESANQFAEKLVGSAADEGANRLSQLLERTDEEIVDRHKEMLKSIISKLESGEIAHPLNEDQLDQALERLKQWLRLLESGSDTRQVLVDRVRTKLAEIKQKIESGTLEPPKPDCERLAQDENREGLPDGLRAKIAELKGKFCS